MSNEKTLIPTLPQTTPGINDSAPPLDLSTSSSIARPDVAGAVGGKAPPSNSRFDEAVSEADSDFVNHQNQQPNQQPTNKANLPVNSKYFKGDLYPRFLVIKHQDPNKNIAAENKIMIGNGLRDIVNNRHYQRIKIKFQFNSRFLLIEANERVTAERLLNANRLQTIPIKVEVHQSKNSCKGVIFNDYYNYTDSEIQQELQSQLVSDAHRIVNSKGEKTPTIILTFSTERPPTSVKFGDHDDLSTRVYPYKQRPRQCTSCLVFGHGPKFCRKEKLCHKCAEPADHKADACPNQVRCFNCEGEHSALSKDCPLYTIEEAVITQKERTNADIEKCRTHVIRTHSLIDRIPKLKEKRDKLPPLLSQIVASGTTNKSLGSPNGPPANQAHHLPQQQSPDLMKGMLSRMEEMMTRQEEMMTRREEMMTRREEMMTEQMTQISSQLASLASVPQQLSDLRDTMMSRVDSHRDSIKSLQGTLNDLQETVNILLQSPYLAKHYRDKIAEQQIQTKAPQGASTALDNGRKSRSLDRDRRRRGSSQSRSKTPLRSPMEQEPSTPSRGIKRRTVERSPPSSPEANKEKVPPPKEAPKEAPKDGCDTIPPSGKKAHRPSSKEPPEPPKEGEPLATPLAPEEEPATTETATKQANPNKGGKSETRPKIITGLKAGKFPSKTPKR